MNGKMTAAVLYGKEDIKIERVPIPRVGDGEVLVKVLAVRRIQERPGLIVGLEPLLDLQ